MADEKVEEGNPLAPALVVIVVIVGSLLLLYQRGDLGKLNSKELFIPPPQETPADTLNLDEGGNSYAGQDLQQNSYTVEPTTAP